MIERRRRAWTRDTTICSVSISFHDDTAKHRHFAVQSMDVSTAFLDYHCWQWYTYKILRTSTTIIIRPMHIIPDCICITAKNIYIYITLFHQKLVDNKKMRENSQDKNSTDVITAEITKPATRTVQMKVIWQGEENCCRSNSKLDARQSLTVAHPRLSIPLAAC